MNIIFYWDIQYSCKHLWWFFSEELLYDVTTRFILCNHNTHTHMLSVLRTFNIKWFYCIYIFKLLEMDALLIHELIQPFFRGLATWEFNIVIDLCSEIWYWTLTFTLNSRSIKEFGPITVGLWVQNNDWHGQSGASYIIVRGEDLEFVKDERL